MATPHHMPFVRDRIPAACREGAITSSQPRFVSGSQHNLYWGSRAYIWNNTGDTAYLKNSVGTLKDSCGWGSVASYVLC